MTGWDATHNFTFDVIRNFGTSHCAGAFYVPSIEGPSFHDRFSQFVTITRSPRCLLATRNDFVIFRDHVHFRFGNRPIVQHHFLPKSTYTFPNPFEFLIANPSFFSKIFLS